MLSFSYSPVHNFVVADSRNAFVIIVMMLSRSLHISRRICFRRLAFTIYKTIQSPTHQEHVAFLLSLLSSLLLFFLSPLVSFLRTSETPGGKFTSPRNQPGTVSANRASSEPALFDERVGGAIAFRGFPYKVLVPHFVGHTLFN